MTTLYIAAYYFGVLLVLLFAVWVWMKITNAFHNVHWLLSSVFVILSFYLAYNYGIEVARHIAVMRGN